jgi:hypothetical protein
MIADAIMKTRSAAEKDAQWHESLDRRWAREYFAKARATKDAGWRTRFLTIARARRDWRMPRWKRNAWPSSAGYIEVWPSEHAWNCDRVNLRFFDSRGVPVVTLGATGTLDFIDGLAKTVFDYCHDADEHGTLDEVSDDLVFKSTNEIGLPPASKGL